MLVSRVTPEQARKEILGPAEIETWHPVGTMFDEWLARYRIGQGDELWFYDSGPESWANLAGRCGYAVVRDGEVIDNWLHLMN